MRTFTVCRGTDMTGVLGQGVVGRGVVFDDGTTVVRWQGEHCATLVWDTFTDAAAHLTFGHEGSTHCEFDHGGV